MVAGARQPAHAQPGDFVRDVDEVVRLVERHHPGPFTRKPREAWLAEARSIRHAASTGATPVDLAARMMAWVASLGDGHTNLEPEGVAGFRFWYPVRFYLFADGLHVTGATGAGVPLNGDRVHRIGGASARHAARRQAHLQGADNRFGEREETYLLSNAGVMRALDLAEEDGTLELVVGDGSGRRTVRLTPVETEGFRFGWRFSGEMYGPLLGDARSWRDWRAAYDSAPVESYRTADPGRPLHLRYRLPYYATEVDGQDGTFYYAIHFTQNWHGDDLATFTRNVFEATDSVPDPTLILDLRYNSGGDGSLILPVVHGIIRRPRLNDPERLFVLVGPKTFSAAVMLVGLLAEHTRATFVGTPPGAGPHHFGDARDFVLPGTGMRLGVSTLYHQYGLSTDTARVFPVDVPAPMTAEAYFAGRDPALDAILGDEDVRPATVIATEDGVDSVRSVVDARRARADELGWTGWAPFRESELKYLGYEELLQGRAEAAARLLTLVVESYPDSWDAWDRLGQAYEETGRVEDAVAAYRRSLELDPDNVAARAALERLTKEGCPEGASSVDLPGPVPACIEEVSFASGDLRLAGDWFTPPGATDPLPGVVVARGSGESVRRNPWTESLAGVLVAEGVGVLVPDKRGSGRSEGDSRTADFVDLADDALAGVRHLAARPDVRPGRIGLMGLSQGGQIVPVAAARSDSVAFVVNVVGAAIPFMENVRYEMLHSFREEGLEGERLEAAMGMVDTAIGHVRGTVAWDAYVGALRHARGTLGDELTDAYFISAPDHWRWGFFRALADFDPVDWWRRVAQPSLVLLGEADPNTPTAESAARLRRVFRETGHPCARVAVFEGLGHALWDMSGPMSEHGLHADVRRTLASWIRRVAEEKP